MRGGTTTVELDAATMDEWGLHLGTVDQAGRVSTDPHPARVLPIDRASTLLFSVSDDGVVEPVGGRILHYGSFAVSMPGRERGLRDPFVGGLNDATFETLKLSDPTHGPQGGLVLERVKLGFDRASQTLTIHAGEVHLSPIWAEAFGDPAVGLPSIGKVTVQALAEWVEGAEPADDQDFTLATEDRATGPDMTFCQLYGLGQYGREGDIVGLSEATTSWNVGDADVMWFSIPDEEHPFIVMNVFRLKDDRFEQIGQSWVKHGFYALGSTQCGGSCTFEPGHSVGDWLGMGCTDTYSAPLNAAQNGLGPRYEVNPWTGEWTYPGSHLSQGSHSHDGIEHRLQVYDDDLDPALNPGATYYAEGYYAILDDVNVMNSAAWKPVTVSGSPGGTWSFSMSGAGTMAESGFAIDAWGGAQRVMLAQEIPVREFASPDGRCVLAAKATPVSGNTWHYEYALLNIDMDRKVGAFTIPVTPGTIITNIGFHAVHHDEELAGYSNDPWSVDTSSGAITWSTADNPVRWGTLYNFRFDANVPPNPEDVTVTLGMFDPGTPDVVTGLTIGPEQGPPDCNTNGIEDSCDLDCGPPGGACDVPGCGGSFDCNTNGFPDECETDCNDSGAPDDCDLAYGTSEDCDGNGVPDECDPDGDGDGVPDGCDICPGFDDAIDGDGDGVPDGCDLCPGHDDLLDTDGDGWIDGCDNCPNDYNPGQEDADDDGIGNLCDPDFCDTQIMDEHFDTQPPGWTVESIELMDGEWEWGVPIGGGDRYDPPDDFDGGGACYLTDNTDGNSDVDGGPTRLITPLLNLRGGNARLEYAYWFGWDDGDGDDRLTVEVSVNGGGDWTEVAVHNDVGVREWRTHWLRLDDFVTPSAATLIRFSVKDNPSNSVVEAAIDAVNITANCFPDCNDNYVDDLIDIAAGTSTDCNSNSIPDECDLAAATSADCNSNAISDECDIAAGSSSDANTNGIPDECEVLGDALRGGLLWDKWWTVIFAPEPSGTHPLYPPAGQQSGSATYRCKECHGWDYKGVEGVYGSGSHYTGIGGVFGSTMTPAEMFDLIKLDTVPDGHGYENYGLTDQDVWDLVEFLRTRAIDTDGYVSQEGLFLGNPEWGQVHYEFDGTIACIQCHGFDGTQRNFGTCEQPVWVGTMAVENPWELLHKIRFGDPGTPMPSWLEAGQTDQGAADIGTYAQVAFPTDCSDNPACYDCNTNALPDACEPAFDFNGDGWIGAEEYVYFQACMTGPCGDAPCYPPLYADGCCGLADDDKDGDVDLDDFAGFSKSLGHLPFPLRDYAGHVITLDSAEPYSGRHTCGPCHDVDHVTNGFLFEQGRTNLAGEVDMRPDYDDNGRFWNMSAARYGRWGQTFKFLLAAKENANESEIEQGTFAWVRDCSSCHVGGGPGEFDRDDVPLYDPVTGQFGWQVLGTDPSLDGDYVDINYATGALRQAPWDVTGVSGPDCLYCHRAQRNITRERRERSFPPGDFHDAGRGDNNYSWRAGVLSKAETLVDDLGQPVPAYAAAGTAGQGWFSNLSLSASPPVLQIDYAVGVAEGSLLTGAEDELLVAEGFLARPPKDRVCDSCHPFETVTGCTWFDERDIHFRKFTRRNDEDPNNDVPDDDATVCTECHPGDLSHNFARGGSMQIHYRDELDWVNFRTCRNCHLYEIAPGVPNPNKHPDAPDVAGGTDTVRVHLAGTADNGPMVKMSCQACHIPYALATGVLFRDNTVGSVGFTNQYYSADPLNPTDPDKSRWYPSLRWKEDVDGVVRLFPVSEWIIFYWGDWNTNGTPGDLHDDVIRPIINWRVNQAVGQSTPLPIVQDDNGDGILEIDQPEELLAYFERLEGTDSYGRQVAAKPVLVRGPRVWYEDPQAPDGVNSFAHAGTGIPMDPYPYLWEKDHNVLAATEAWGAGEDCQTCHRTDGQSPVFDRRILVDPYGQPETSPVYKTLRELTGVDTTSYHDDIVLRDVIGNPLTGVSSAPYSGRQTCGIGGCHDIDRVSNGTIHQHGRTDTEGNIVMHDDYFGDGRWWVRSAGMYGRWSGGGGGLNRQTAGKDNASESVIDMTSYYWAGFCGGCHAGGGGMEFDRDGIRYWDQATGQFGYEVLGKTAEQVALDGDYAFIDADHDGAWSLAPWDVTGVADPECLHCHRANRAYMGNQDMHREWRAAVLGARADLVDSLGASVPAYAAAGTAGQGWFSALDTSANPPVLQIDYSVGVTAGDFQVNTNGELVLAPGFLARPPRDQACWGCHLPGGFQNKRGTVWFDERDVMYAGFNLLTDADPNNDIPPELSTACNTCHPNDIDHDEAKGDSPYTQFRNELDWANFRSCRECHLSDIAGVPNPQKDPAAPDVPGIAQIHLAGDETAGPMRAMSCQGCHVPYPLARAIIATDRSVTGGDTFYYTDEFLSANPIDPTDEDTSTWYPALTWKTDSDGVERLFPQKKEVIVYWADWNTNGTPGVLSDDAVHPVILWRLRQITGGVPLAGVTDDNGDGKLEINRPAEMLPYMQALKGNDSYGRQVAANPVLVKGERVWYEDPEAPDGVSGFEHEGSGVYVQGFEVFGLDHNVLAATEAWGAGFPPFCDDCHRQDGQSPVFDRLVLVDPFDVNGDPVYKTVREMTGTNPP